MCAALIAGEKEGLLRNAPHNGQDVSGPVFPGVYKHLETKDPTYLLAFMQKGRRIQHDFQGPIPNLLFFFFKGSIQEYTSSRLLIHQAI